MPTFVKTESGTWKAVIRKTGWPTTVKTFRTNDRERGRAKILSERLGSYSLAAITSDLVARFRDG